jgi:asparagine synthase (glutamine-hydrolysing)
MCGIFCAISFNQRFTYKEFEQFKVLTDLVSHRGPDASGYKRYSTSMISNDETFNIFFGHRRLSIIDLSVNGNQPMESDNISIIYNGEIFNYLELREELRSRGVSFKTNSDTEVILKIYETEGTKGFAKLNGMWAFIIYDLQKNIIITSRDRFSLKPLFYLNLGTNFFLASEIKQLIPLLNKKELNSNAMFNFIKQALTDYSDDTFFNSIKKVKPKTNLIINLSQGEFKEETYWDYEPISIGSEKNAFEMFREILFDSVSMRLRSDVDVGSLLSGGLDSSAISIIASKFNLTDFKTFSIISDDENFSEEEYIDEFVNQTGIKNLKIPFDANEVLNSIDSVICNQDEPFGSFSIIAQNLIFKKIKENSDTVVVLSGQGGDEIMMGYLKFFFFYLKDLARKKRIDLLLKELFQSLVNRTILYQFNMSAAKRYIKQLQKEKNHFILFEGNNEVIWESNDLKKRQIDDIDKYSIPALARYEDRNSMAYSVESRVPFLDHRLVNLLINMKPELKLKRGWSKYVLRKALTELPERIKWRRDKRNFLIPEDKWLRINLSNSIKTLFNDSYLNRFGIVDDRKFLNYYNEYLKGSKLIHHADISRVYIAEKWLRQNFT